MDLGTRMVRLASAWGFAVLTAVACSSPAPKHDSCGPAHATFRLYVDADEGRVPADVQIHVRYGSGEESFDARDPDAALKVVFCELEREGEPDAGPDTAGADPEAGAIRQVVCDLWTDGAATVRVEANGYPEVTRDLEAERDDRCGLLLTEARITLQREAQD
ncbi:MAG: hypothetical protein ACOC1F_04195 [Myxococcota bacterium]